MGDYAERIPRQDRPRRARDADVQQEQMEITIDSQSFVNLGQLMESRLSFTDTTYVTGGGVTGNVGGGGGPSFSTTSSHNVGASSNMMALSSFLSDGSHEEVDQIFHHPAASSSSAWSGQELCLDGDIDGEDDDDDSVLPALPPRSPTLESPMVPEQGVTASWNSRPLTRDKSASDKGSGSGDDLRSNPVTRTGSQLCEDATVAEASIMPEAKRSSLEKRHDESDSKRGSNPGIPIYTQLSPSLVPIATVQGERETVAARARIAGDAGVENKGNLQQPTSYLRESWLHVPMDNSEIGHDDGVSEHVCHSTGDEESRSGIGGMESWVLRAAAALKDRSCALIDGGKETVALLVPVLERFAQRVMVQVEAGLGPFKRTQQLLVQAIDAVPQAPVRMWVARVACSLVLGTILGGAAVYRVLSRSSTAPAPSCSGSEATSPWWYSSTNGQYCESSAGFDQQAFVERLNKALFAARAGEAAAQQGLLEEVRNILAATGESGGISAERILRQFNAKRFTEASKAWSTAEGIAGADPLDPLFFAPPTTPVYKTNPSSPPQQQYSAPHSGTATADCSVGSSCSSDDAEGALGASRGYHVNSGEGDGGISGVEGASTSRRFNRRPCGGGGWVC